MSDNVRDKYYKLIMITAGQCRAARGLLNWTQQDLKERAGTSLSAVQTFEREERKPIVRNMEAIRGAFEEAGVEFIPENGGGPGVRLKNSI